MSFPHVPEVPDRVAALENVMGDAEVKCVLVILGAPNDRGEGLWTTPGESFFHGWKPFPAAASANGGGVLLVILLH